MSTTMGAYSSSGPRAGAALQGAWPGLSRPYYSGRLAQAISVGDIFCLVMPLLQVVRFDIVGEMCASDFLVMAALPVALARHPERLRQKPMPTILLLGILWLAAQILSDVIRASAPQDFLRGWSKICLLLANLLVVWLVACRSQRRFLLYCTGLTIGSILAFFAFPSGDAALAPWKFALGIPATVLALMWVPKLIRRPYLGILISVLALAAVDSFEDCRSLAVITFISAVYSVQQMATAGRRKERSILQMALLGISVGLALWGFTAIYSHYAEQGMFGEYAQRKLALQQGGTGGLLLGGRSEILGSGQAIMDSPVLGHGSWARDPKYSDIQAQKRAEMGYKDVDGHGARRDDLIPTHSYIFGAWVDAGIAGAIFWSYIIWFTSVTLLKVSGAEPLLPVFAFGGFLLLWDIFFSPLGMPTRFVSPFFMAAMIALSTLRHSSELD
jgi:hypothetical protein